MTVTADHDEAGAGRRRLRGLRLSRIPEAGALVVVLLAWLPSSPFGPSIS